MITFPDARCASLKDLRDFPYVGLLTQLGVPCETRSIKSFNSSLPSE